MVAHDEMETERHKRRFVRVLLVATVAMLAASLAAHWIGPWLARVVVVAAGLAILLAWLRLLAGGGGA